MTLHQKLKSLKRRRRILLVLTLIGLAGSAAGNVLNALPTPTARIIALAPPVLFFGAFEVASRFHMAKERHLAVKVSLFAVLGGLAILMAINSYFHQRDAFHRETQDWLTAYSLPISIDLFMLICAILVLEHEAQIRDIQARLVSNPKAKVDDNVPVAPKERQPSGKERVAMLLAKHPEITLKDLHQQAGVSLSYATSVAKQVRALHQQPA